MLTPQCLSWEDPLKLASAIDEPYWVLLYSGVQAGYSGRYSYLACSLAERVEGSDFSSFESRLTDDDKWFGYLGYGLKDSLEALAPDPPDRPALPNLCMMRFHTVYEFDHEERKLICYPPTSSPLRKNNAAITPSMAFKVEGNIRSNMTDGEYLEKAAHIIGCIGRGDLYQANLTRKFFGKLEGKPDHFGLFKKLCEVSPAPYSAFLRIDNKYILSSSPELFLKIDAQGHMRSRPIKGTAPRFENPDEDRRSRDALRASDKDRAENLMIVDLMRNDFSRCCIPGSVRAESLFEVTAHATIHHMSGTVVGVKRPDCGALDAVKSCFPPGSMTGAPKIAAMNLCSRLEAAARGVYSGAIGWLGGDGACELSVVIRTLVMQGRDFEFQVGGGIVADSTPEGELQEIRDKSKGILLALGIM